MKAKRTRRAGATETFSVSVDPETKRALRALADSAFGGNLSALVTDLAEEARRAGGGAYLERHGIAEPTPQSAAQIESAIEREISTAKRRRRKKAA